MVGTLKNMFKFRLLSHLTSLCVILLEKSVVPAEATDAYYKIEKSRHVEYLHSCCDFNQLKSHKSCDSSLKRSLSDLDKLRKVFGDKLNCNKNLIQNIKVNIAEDDIRSQHNFLVQSDRSERIFLNGTAYPRDSYCVHNIDGLPDYLSLLICSPGCSKDSPCYKKCCKLHESLTYDKDHSGKCIWAKDKQFNFFKNLAARISKTNFTSSKFMVNSSFNFHGSCGRQPDANRTKFWLSHKGTLEFKLDYNNFIRIKDFCVDQLLNENGNFIEMTAHYCHSEFVSHLWTSFSLQLVYTSISSLFLGVSIWVFFVIRSEHSIHGWTQFAFLIAAFVFYFTRVALNAVFMYRLHRNYTNDKVTGVIMEFIERFFWNGLYTNVVGMNFHIFWTLLKPKPETKQVNREELKSLVISVLAYWIVACVITIVEVALIFSTEDDTKRANLIDLMFYIIDVPICVVTLLLALGSSFILIRRIRDHLKISSGRTSSSAQIAATFLRLFCVTGLIWTSVVIEMHLTEDPYNKGWIWEIFHFLFYINGVVLSFVFVCNRQTLERLRQRFPEYLHLRDSEKIDVVTYTSSHQSGAS